MIEELLHTGIQNALSPEYLAAVTGLDSVRAVQKQIERERRSGAVILSSTVPPGGYYLPANRSEVMRFIRTLENRSTGDYGSIAEREEVSAAVPGVSRGRKGKA